MAGILLSQFRAQEGSDPEVFVPSVATILSHYPESIVRQVCDPYHGLAGKQRWLPSLFEVREACDKAMEPIRAAERQAALEARTLQGRLAPPEARPRPTLEELQERCGGPSWGINPDERDEASVPRALAAANEVADKTWAGLSDAEKRVRLGFPAAPNPDLA